MLRLAMTTTTALILSALAVLLATACGATGALPETGNNAGIPGTEAAPEPDTGDIDRAVKATLDAHARDDAEYAQRQTVAARVATARAPTPTPTPRPTPTQDELYALSAMAQDVYACYERLPAAERNAAKQGYDLVNSEWLALTPSDMASWMTMRRYLDRPDDSTRFARWILDRHISNIYPLNPRPQSGYIQESFDALCPDGGFIYAQPPPSG